MKGSLITPLPCIISLVYLCNDEEGDADGEAGDEEDGTTAIMLVINAQSLLYLGMVLIPIQPLV